MFSKRGKAFECDKCPKNNNPELGNFCPAWWEQAWTEQGKDVIKKDCAFKLLPNMMVVLGATARMSMNTSHALDAKLASTDRMCEKVSEKMEGLARAFYIAANRAEYLSNEGKSSGTFQRAGDADSPGSGFLVDGSEGYTPTDGRGCGGQDTAEGRIGPDADYDSRGTQDFGAPSDTYRNEDSTGERIYQSSERDNDSSDCSARVDD